MSLTDARDGPPLLEEMGELIDLDPRTSRLLAKLPYLEKCLDELHSNKQFITCPACGDEVHKDILSWEVHWRLKHPDLKEELIAEGVDW